MGDRGVCEACETLRAGQRRWMVSGGREGVWSSGWQILDSLGRIRPMQQAAKSDLWTSDIQASEHRQFTTSTRDVHAHPISPHPVTLSKGLLLCPPLYTRSPPTVWPPGTLRAQRPSPDCPSRRRELPHSVGEAQ
jgi:hypothetical protein